MMRLLFSAIALVFALAVSVTAQAQFDKLLQGLGNAVQELQKQVETPKSTNMDGSNRSKFYLYKQDNRSTRAIGTVANADEICKVLNHKFLTEDRYSSYRNIVGTGPNWLGRHEKDGFIFLNKGYDEAHSNYEVCWSKLKNKKAVFQATTLTKKRQNVGNFRTPFYDKAHYWILTLYVKEQHPLLVKILDDAIPRAEKLIAEKEAEKENERRKELAEKKQADLTRQKHEQAYKSTETIVSKYKSREKTLLEQVLNYASTGDKEGRFPGEFWVETGKCNLDQYEFRFDRALSIANKGETYVWKKVFSVDIRKLDQTAFRMKQVRSGETWLHISTDFKNIEITGPASIASDRLQKAWTLAFNECPGKKSAF